ncbi:transmembrane anterior posterior transformation protein 1 homolog [Sinocyclocheilus grahami]|uniref:transmembrane anterior posterior transformation protein 1 homolog n=1 Tax=Sinocyclocheilus grahami TaxID=75366 RepID=UPI0007AD0CC4|nr:PREDICTED: transmembrane anterior posterior transformation protein 1 homolog [Sinocyclocheilus grahami]
MSFLPVFYLDDSVGPSLLRFTCAELTRGYFLEHNEAKYTERRERVYTCMRIPKELERLMIFGFFLCLDAFLYVFTLLPLRTLLAFLRLLTIPCCGLGANVCPYCRRSSLYIKERFTNSVLLLIVCLRNMEQFSWNSDHLWVLLPDVLIVIMSEVAVDIVKHAFITKFNDITADVYSEYKASLAFELVSSRQQNAYTDYSDSVARRMGFIPLPLAVLLIRVVMSSVKIQGALSSVCLLLFYLGLITMKVLNNIVILGKSCRYVKEANMEGKLFERPTAQTSKQTPKKANPTKSPPPSAEPKVQQPSTSITKQPSPRAKPFPPAPPPVTEVTSDSPPDSPPKPEESSSETPQSTELKHRATKKDLLEIDRFTICGNRIG